MKGNYLATRRAVEAYSLQQFQYYNADAYPEWVQNMMKANKIVCYRYYLEIYVDDNKYKAKYDDFIVKYPNGWVTVIPKAVVQDHFDKIVEGGA